MIKKDKKLPEKYPKVLDEMSDMFLIIGPNDKFLFVNKMWTDTVGYSLKEAKSLSFKSTVDKDSVGILEDILTILSKNKKADSIKLTFISKKG